RQEIANAHEKKSNSDWSQTVDGYGLSQRRRENHHLRSEHEQHDQDNDSLESAREAGIIVPSRIDRRNPFQHAPQEHEQNRKRPRAPFAAAVSINFTSKVPVSRDRRRQ